MPLHHRHPGSVWILCDRILCGPGIGIFLAAAPAPAWGSGFGTQAAGHWPVVLAVVATAAVIIVYLLQNRRLKNKTGELRRELFERQIAEKELLASHRELRQSLAEKEALLKEIHHRVKNNLQIVSSLLYLHEDLMEDPRGLEILRESQNRVKSMGLIHEQLYSTQNLAGIDFGRYLHGLTAHLLAACGVDPERLALHIEARGIFLDLATAVPCALMVNELVTNAIKHAFPANAGGTIRIRVGLAENGRLEIVVADDGIGLADAPAGADSASLGLRLIDMLARQLDGRATLENDRGTRCTIVVAMPEPRKKEG